MKGRESVDFARTHAFTRRGSQVQVLYCHQRKQGFTADKGSYRPFRAETLAAEYPAVDKTLAPFEAALDKLLKVHPQLDAAVRELAKM